MHNLHLIVVNAESGLEACSEAESFILDWGNENNWRTMCGAVSEDNEVYLAGDGAFEPDEKTNTIEKINTMVKDWFGDNIYIEAAKKALAEGKKVEDFDTSELYSLQRYAELLYQRKSTDTENFDVLKHEFYAYSYDENGVTQNEMGEGKKWVVFADIHS